MRGMRGLVEARIQEAMARGELDHLPGQGKPLPDDDLAGLSRDERLAARLVRCGGGVPEEVRLLKEIEDMERALAAAGRPEERERLRGELGKSRLRLGVLLEQGGRYVSAGRLGGT